MAHDIVFIEDGVVPVNSGNKRWKVEVGDFDWAFTFSLLLVFLAFLKICGAFYVNSVLLRWFGLSSNTVHSYHVSQSRILS
jgi:hypothetical protein